MSKIKLFYSYSHKDEKYRELLEKNLTLLRESNLIDEWHDRKIDAGDCWGDIIDNNMEDASIILLLLSPDFIASQSCRKELSNAFILKEEKNTAIIPIILRHCTWQHIPEIASVLAVPKDGKPISAWQDQDEAWLNVFEAIKNKVNRIQEKREPRINNDFRNCILKESSNGYILNELFIYPDISEVDVDVSKDLANNKKIDSIELQDLKKFNWKYLLIEGEEQSGKTSLCHMLYLHYANNGLYPILLNGRDIIGKVDLKNIVSNHYKDQYEVGIDYWLLDKEKIILLIDDIDEKSAKNEIFSNFILSIKEHFKYAVIFVDELQNLSERSTELSHFSYFHNFTINPLGHRKRDELIKKCISTIEPSYFDENNNEHLARLDRNTKHINTVIGSNIVPSYPIFIITIFNTIEVHGSSDLINTSYGHCYQAMLTMNLGRVGIKAQDIDSHFNLLTQLAYFMFNKGTKSISGNELMEFTTNYKQTFISAFTPDNSIKKLLDANILIKKKGDLYLFQYIYIYYYFVARYISRKMNDKAVMSQLSELMSRIHLKDNANIIVFITHHTNNNEILEQILQNTISTFKNFSEVTLSGDEKSFVNNLSRQVLLDSNHVHERQKELEEKDRLSSSNDRISSDSHEEDLGEDPLLTEIIKSAKCMEIIGQILKNQFGSLEREQLIQLFKEGRDVGLRVLKSFMELMITHENEIELLVQSKLEQSALKNNKSLSKEEKEKQSKKIINSFSYGIIFGWLHKIVDSMGYDKLIEISDEVNNETNTVATKLINISIQTWYKKNLDIAKIKQLYEELEKSNNNQAIYILKDIVARHIYMHTIDYREKQQIKELLSFSIQKQRLIQQNIAKK